MQQVTLTDFMRLAKKVKEIAERELYPVGSICFMMNDIDPSECYGGIWEEIKGRFLFAADEGYEVGATGGVAVHTLTTAEMPTHTHTQNSHTHIVKNSTGVNGLAAATNGATGTDGNDWCFYDQPVDATSKTATFIAAATTAINQETGGGLPHNNMPPYIVVRIWRRIK